MPKRIQAVIQRTNKPEQDLALWARQIEKHNSRCAMVSVLQQASKSLNHTKHPSKYFTNNRIGLLRHIVQPMLKPGQSVDLGAMLLVLYKRQMFPRPFDAFPRLVTNDESSGIVELFTYVNKKKLKEAVRQLLNKHLIGKTKVREIKKSLYPESNPYRKSWIDDAISVDPASLDANTKPKKAIDYKDLIRLRK